MFLWVNCCSKVRKILSNLSKSIFKVTVSVLNLSNKYNLDDLNWVINCDSYQYNTLCYLRSAIGVHMNTYNLSIKSIAKTFIDVVKEKNCLNQLIIVPVSISGMFSFFILEECFIWHELQQISLRPVFRRSFNYIRENLSKKIVW